MWRTSTAFLFLISTNLSTYQIAQAQDIELPSLIVSASPLESQLDETFASISLLSEEEIDRVPARSIGDILFTEPGVISSTFSPGSSRPIIRGLDNFRVGILENGIASHDVSALSEDHAIPIDHLSAKTIEIIRGPATLRWGSQAIGGVVNITNNRIPTAIPGGKYKYLEVEGAYTSVDEAGDGGFQFGLGSGNIAIHADAFKRRGSDYDTPQGKQEGTSYDFKGGAFGTSLILDNGYIGASYSGVSALYFIPGEEAAERDLRIDMEQRKFNSEGEYRFNDGTLAAVKYWFGYTDYEHDEIARDEMTNELGVGSTFKNQQYEARTEILHNPFTTGLGDIKGAIGFQYGFRDLSASGEGGELLSPSETVNFAAYIFEELQATEKTKFQFAARIEQVEIDGAAAEFPSFVFMNEPEAEPASRNFTPYSVSVAGLHQFSNGIVGRLSGQYVERAPDVLELFAKGPHEATETFEIGDPNLNKEKAYAVEIGLKKTTGPLRFDGSVFYTSFNGYIFKNFTGNSCEEGAGCVAGTGEELTQINYAQNDAEFYGFEISGSYDLTQFANGTIGIDGQYDFVRAKFEDGTNVPRITPQRLGAGLYYTSSDIFARVGVLHALRQDDVAVNETATEGYTLLNAEINYTMQLDPVGDSTPEFTISLKGDNLLDDEIRNHVSFKKEDVLLRGRNIMLRGKLKIN